MRITISTIGKKGEAWLEEALQEYQKRLQPFLSLSWNLLKDDAALVRWVSQQRRTILLDPTGKLMDSPTFSHALMKELELGGAQLAFVIGGANGLPDELRGQHTAWSLSPLTLTHRLTRLVLTEQIYRAIAIAQGLPFPR
jgi:23S rRNA (pseudouridine1915-N3)-methyltransferase